MSLRNDVWKSVIQAIEKAIPEYDLVNERVSLGPHRESAIMQSMS